MARSQTARDTRKRPNTTPRTKAMAIEMTVRMTVIFRPAIRIGKVLFNRPRNELSVSAAPLPR